MLRLSATLINQTVLSLRTGGQVATAMIPIINPNNLKIEGFYCDDRFDKKQLILLTQDIRDRVEQGFVINDHEVLVEPEELVRLESVLKLDFQLIGKPVVTVNKQKLGKVNDYAVDDTAFYVQKIYVGQGLLKSFAGGNLSIDRSQITEITDRKIVVLDPLKGVKSTAPAPSAVIS
ncbi:MAG: PRC-barrel domain-containing protein [Patescibacteria group bacterium]